MVFDEDDLRVALDNFETANNVGVGDVTLSNDGVNDEYIYVSNGTAIKQMYVSDLRDAVEEAHEGPFIKATNVTSDYGFIVPLDADIEVERPKYDEDGYTIHFNTNDDVSDLKSVGGPDDMDFDAPVFVSSIEIIDGDEI